MALSYNPADKPEDSGGGGGGRRPSPGTYEFFINDAYEDTFRSGNEGLKVRLDVAAFEDKDITVFDQFIYLPQCYWMLEKFLTCLGFDFNTPPDADQLIGKQGKARFTMGEERQDGKRYLEVEEYLVPGAQRRSGGTPGNMQPQAASAPGSGTTAAPAAAPASQAASAPAPAAPETVDESDVPF